MMTTRSVAEVNVDLAAFCFHRIDGYRHAHWRRLGLAGLEVEASLMQRTLDAAILDVAVGEQRELMRADVVQGVELAAAAHERDGSLAHHHADHLFLAERVRTRHLVPAQPNSPSLFIQCTPHFPTVKARGRARLRPYPAARASFRIALP